MATSRHREAHAVAVTMSDRNTETEQAALATSEAVHGVLNELTVIVMHASDLLSRAGVEDPNTPALREIKRAADTATQLLRRMWSATRPSA